MQKVLVTGASGMLGRYVVSRFSGHEVSTAGRRPECDYPLDLCMTETNLTLPAFDLVVHCAGTVCERDAMRINLNGTALLLKALEQNPPKRLVLISSMSVYGLDCGELIDEEHELKPFTQYGKSKLEAERLVQHWCADRGVVCTILRPAMALGDGVQGRPKMMFDGIRRGYYYNLRDNNARRSIVTAYDVARCVELVTDKGGIYNVCDGYDHTINELADAMAANMGDDKRVFWLPMKWAKLFVGIAATVVKILPRSRRPDVRRAFTILTSTLTFSNRKIQELTGIEFYDTVEVTARRCKDYPYIDLSQCETLEKSTYYLRKLSKIQA